MERAQRPDIRSVASVGSGTPGRDGASAATRHQERSERRLRNTWSRWSERSDQTSGAERATAPEHLVAMERAQRPEIRSGASVGSGTPGRDGASAATRDQERSERRLRNTRSRWSERSYQRSGAERASAPEHLVAMERAQRPDIRS